jgi:succinyl-CoA synthetase beta subunit
VEIETVAHERPGAIIKEPIHPLLGLQAHQARRIAFELGFTGKAVNQAAGIMLSLAKLFVDKDCTLAEINPLVLAVGPGGKGAASSVLAIDAKFSFDDNASFRHPELAAMADPAEENPAELRAKRFGLSYIALEGNIGCLVNGAGLAMATMDIIKLHGGQPANFLDVGGSATEEAVTEAFSIILSDPAVKGILVNIFGGIMRCDIIAQGIINAARSFKAPGAGRGSSGGFAVPLVVRLEGTNVEAGRKLLDDARREIPTMQGATDLADAAKKVCAAVK